MFYTILFTFLGFLFFAILLATGLFFGKKRIPTSCAGISNLGLKRACDCKNPCAEAESKLKAESAAVGQSEDSAKSDSN